MKKIIFISIISVLLNLVGTPIYAQYDLSDAEANFEDGNYEVSLKQYLKAYKKFKTDVKVNYRIGFCYLNTNYDKAKALEFLLFVDSVKNGDYETLKFDLAKAYFHRHEFDKAKELAKAFQGSKTHSAETLAEIDRFMEMCMNAKSLISKPLNVTFVNLGNKVNSPQDDFIPFITEDETFMVFSSARKYNNDYQQFIRGVYFTQKKEGVWQLAKTAGSKINSDENEEAVGINKDGSLVLVHVDRLSSPNDINITEKNKYGSFGELQDLGKTINTKFNEAGASISQSGDTLFFASDRPGGLGGFDIYMSIKLPDETWGMPVNIGEPVNTPNDENYPYITAEGTTLYFSSNGHNSIGGYDIFRSRLLTDKWSEPKNIGFPINDTYDNLNIALTSNARYGYVSKSESDGLGGLDIYRVIFNDLPPTNIIYTGKILVDSLNPVPYNKVDSVIEITVYNKEKNNERFASYQPSKSGKYTIALPPGSWMLEVKGNAYKPYSRDILIRDEQPIQVIVPGNIYLNKK